MAAVARKTRCTMARMPLTPETPTQHGPCVPLPHSRGVARQGGSDALRKHGCNNLHAMPRAVGHGATGKPTRPKWCAGARYPQRSAHIDDTGRRSEGADGTRHGGACSVRPRRCTRCLHGCCGRGGYVSTRALAWQHGQRARRYDTGKHSQASAPPLLHATGITWSLTCSHGRQQLGQAATRCQPWTFSSWCIRLTRSGQSTGVISWPSSRYALVISAGGPTPTPASGAPAGYVVEGHVQQWLPANRHLTGMKGGSLEACLVAWRAGCEATVSLQVQRMVRPGLVAGSVHAG